VPTTKSPLRYPGGKTQLAKFVNHTIKLNGIQYPIYCEPFSGGAGVAIALLLSEQADSIILNDYDTAIYSFWYAVLNDTERLMQKIIDTPITLPVWHEEHRIYDELNELNDYNFDLAFATFFLNRTNHAGIITGGPVGGFEQKSKYTVNCRFNKENLIEKIRIIATQRHRISLYHMDAVDFIPNILLNQPTERLFTFFDPPYYQQGKKLYKNAFNNKKHVELSHAIRTMSKFSWITTYDNDNHIQEIYQDMDIKYYELQYSANNKRREKEIFFHSPITKVESFDKVIFID